METPKKPGRPRKYSGTGAPQVLLRLDQPIYERVTSRPEGPRAYVTRLVEADIRTEQQTSGAEQADGIDAHSAVVED